jgi:hypothetical protein
MTTRVWVLFASFLIAWLPLTATASPPERSTEWRTKPIPKKRLASVDAARTMMNYASCVVGRRYERARLVALAEYGSDAQAIAAGRVANSSDDACLYGFQDNVSMTFDPAVLGGAIAQVLTLREYPDLPALVAATAFEDAVEFPRVLGLAPMELFGRCVVRHDPHAAMALFAALPGTNEESAAVGVLSDDFNPCLAIGSKIELNAMSLRNAMGVGAYRLGTQLRSKSAKAGQ